MTGVFFHSRVNDYKLSTAKMVAAHARILTDFTFCTFLLASRYKTLEMGPNRTFFIFNDVKIRACTVSFENLFKIYKIKNFINSIRDQEVMPKYIHKTEINAVYATMDTYSGN